MVRGLDKFKEHFSAYTDHFVLIGGVASYLVMDEAGADFRATKDLDIVLCLEVLDSDFVRTFWTFIQEGRYQIKEKSTGERVFYRFCKPEDDFFPVMLELFSRNPDGVTLGEDDQLTPIPVEEDVSSLSAILLDDDYYDFLHQHKKEIEGIPVVSEYCLIPLKAKAWLDLTRRKESGEQIDGKNIAKHKKDVFRLFQILNPDEQVELAESVQNDMHEYLNAISSEQPVDLSPFGLKGLSVPNVVNQLREIYRLNQ